MKVSDISNEVLQMRAVNKVCNDVWQGTTHLRSLGQVYLPKFEIESDKAYKKRLGAAVCKPYLRETIKTFVSGLLKGGVNFEGVDEKISQYFDNVTGDGVNLSSFLTNVYQDAFLNGVSYVFVDYENELNRPVFKHIKNAQILGWKYKDLNLEQVRFIYKAEKDDGDFGVKFVNTIIVLQKDSFRKFEQQNNGEYYKVDERQIKAKKGGLSSIPFVAFNTASDNGMFATSQFEDLANFNIKHYQACSAQDNIVMFLRQPIVVATGINNMDSLDVGSNLISLPEKGDIKFIEHSGNSINAGSEHIKKIEDDLKMCGAKILANVEFAMTEDQAVNEAEKEVQGLRYFAEKIEDCTNYCIRIFGEWLGIKDAGEVDISSNIKNPRKNVIDNVKTVYELGLIDREQAFLMLQKNDIISETFTLQPDKNSVK